MEISYHQRGSFKFCKIHTREQAVAFHEEMEVELAFEFQKWIRGYFRQSAGFKFWFVLCSSINKH